MALGARLQSFLRYGKYSSRQRVGNPIAEFYPLEVDIDVVYQNFQTVPIGCSQCRRIGGIDSIGRHKAHGIYSAYQSLPIYAEVFERLGRLDRLEDFAGSFGANFYGLPRNRQTIVLTKRKQMVPAFCGSESLPIVPLKRNETISWSKLENP